MREGICIARIQVPTPFSSHVARALQPDNQRTPPYLSVSCKEVQGNLECKVTVEGCSDPKRILTLRNTVDDLLIAIRAALDSLE
ncbi:MAG: hypothetical protein F7C82_01505 [Desulfurococcales archaeon]|nr:hypothetical protein [Desulfurococcales archaeon]MCE4628936.1 hypothetical protein [Desulfurococcales archaeon]